MTTTGRCLCGQVKLEFEGEPLSSGSCHCRDCQYVSGGHPAVGISVPTSSFRVEGEVRKYRSIADFGTEVYRAFCPNCGTPLFAGVDGRPWLAIKLGALDDPSAFPPKSHIWTSSAQPWHHLDPDAEQMPKQRPGATDLHQAAIEGDLEAAWQAIRSGADLNAREPGGESSPLMLAAVFGHTEVAKALIESGADVDQQNVVGSTALLAAVQFCRTEILEALLEAGADKSIASNEGYTPFDFATAPFERVVSFYNTMAAQLKPLGLELDYERLKASRPRIAEMLR